MRFPKLISKMIFPFGTVEMREDTSLVVMHGDSFPANVTAATASTKMHTCASCPASRNASFTSPSTSTSQTPIQTHVPPSRLSQGGNMWIGDLLQARNASHALYEYRKTINGSSAPLPPPLSSRLAHVSQPQNVMYDTECMVIELDSDGSDSDSL